jgi:hypothetical protein
MAFALPVVARRRVVKKKAAGGASAAAEENVPLALANFSGAGKLSVKSGT